MIIRKALPSDMPDVLKLIQELAVYEKEPDAVNITVETLQEHGFGDTPLFTCFVAAFNNTVVGTAICYNRFSTWEGKSLHLEDLIVTASQRGKGVGQKLYDQVMQHGKETGVARVEWVVLDWNKSAISFYKKSGAQFLKDWYLVQMDKNQLDVYVKKIKK